MATEIANEHTSSPLVAPQRPQNVCAMISGNSLLCLNAEDVRSLIVRPLQPRAARALQALQTYDSGVPISHWETDRVP